MNRLLAPFLLVAGLTLGLVSCDPAKSNSTDTTGGSTGQIDLEPEQISKTYNTPKDLNPAVNPPDTANLILGGRLIEVHLQEIRNDSSVIFAWLTPPSGSGQEGVEIEREKYGFSNTGFSLLAGPAESFESGIPLIKFPFTIGDSYDWEGVQYLGKNKRTAKAKVTTSAEQVNLETGNFETVLVTIDLTVETGTPGGSQSQFKFWIKPGEGVVKREFGFSSTREPRESNSDSNQTVK